MRPEELREAIESTAGVEWEVAEEPIEAEGALGYLPSEGVPTLAEQVALAARLGAAPPPVAPAYPFSCDLRATAAGNMITPIRDQRPCASCVAFGACAAVEGTLRIERKDPNLQVDLSEAYLFYCVAAVEECDCGPGPKEGWWPKKALEAFKAEGVPDEACFPYTARNQACKVCDGWRSKATTIADWQALDKPAEMKAWIAQHGPIVASMAVFEDLLHYADGVYSHVSGPELGGHCICVVGYDDQGGYWICKNSWGTGWGEAGFFRIAYGQCGIDSGMLGVEGVRPPTGP